MPHGYFGRILVVDLGTGESHHEELPADVYERFLGGVGLAAKVLWDRVAPGTDPLGPEALLGFVPGLLTDTGSVFTGRFLVVGRSPATGGWGDANCGGNFSPALKRCGIDGLFIRGRSETPCLLRVDAAGAEILPADDLWGRDAVEAERRLLERFGKKARVACIGPAGEARSLISGVVNDGGRIAARGGLGAVMGSKHLKAVVAMGDRRVTVARKERMTELTRAFTGRIPTEGTLSRFLGDPLLGLTGWITRNSSLLPRQPADLWRLLLARFGTPALTAMSAEAGDSPVKNWAGVGTVDFPLSRSQRIGAEAVVRHEVKKYGCHSCPLRCGGIVRMPEAGIEEMHKPEYETLCAFGTLLLNDDLPSIFKLNDRCNRAGMDTISAGATVAFAVECFEAGLLTSADTDGLELRWGDGAAALALLDRMVRREGIGDVLADGVRRAAERIGRGSEAFAVHCGGMEAPMHDPKYDPGQLVAYACEPTPGRHTISALQYLELQQLEKQFPEAPRLPPLALRMHKYRERGKGDWLKVDTAYKNLVDAAGACLFGTQVGGSIPLVEWIGAATGWERTPSDYLRVGERIEQLRHAFNVREGIHALRDFRPHPRLYGDPPQRRGPHRGLTVDLDAWSREFYGAMRWALHDSRPDPAHLRALDLPEVPPALEVLPVGTTTGTG